MGIPSREEVAVTDNPQNVAEAAAAGDYLAVLRAMQRRTAEAIDASTTPARDLAALTRRMLEITKEIQAVEVAEREEREKSTREEEARNGTAAFDPSTV